METLKVWGAPGSGAGVGWGSSCATGPRWLFGWSLGSPLGAMEVLPMSQRDPSTGKGGSGNGHCSPVPPQCSQFSLAG